jgi:hypothetical protein
LLVLFLWVLGGAAAWLVVDAEIGLRCFDVQLVAGAGEVQWAGLGLWTLALPEQVDDGFAIVGGHEVRVAEGFGDLRAGVAAFEREDVSQMRGGVEASLYEAFAPEKARALCERFEMHYTPKHGSWLNMAEIEIGLLARTCLNRRIESVAKFSREISAYLRNKNAEPKPINWQFTNQKARTKLRSFYPSI